MKIETEGSLRVLTLSRTEKLNALNTAEWASLLSEVRNAEADERIRVIVLRAEGKVFCAGNDIVETSRFVSKSEARTYFLDLMMPTLAAMASCRLPIVAEVRGDALGAGFELLQFCDIVVASNSSSFRLPEVGLGLWATVFLGATSYSGNRRTTQRMVLTGTAISAREAVEAQLVSLVVPDEDVHDRVWEIAHAIAANAPDAVAVSKKYANHALIETSLPVIRSALSDLIDQTLFSDEGREGVSSFLEKRMPDFGQSPTVNAMTHSIQ